MTCPEVIKPESLIFSDWTYLWLKAACGASVSFCWKILPNVFHQINIDCHKWNLCFYPPCSDSANHVFCGNCMELHLHPSTIISSSKKIKVNVEPKPPLWGAACRYRYGQGSRFNSIQAKSMGMIPWEEIIQHMYYLLSKLHSSYNNLAGQCKLVQQPVKCSI